MRTWSASLVLSDESENEVTSVLLRSDPVKANGDSFVWNGCSKSMDRLR